MPVYRGVTDMEVSLTATTVAFPELQETGANVGKGTTNAMGNGRMLCAQVNGDVDHGWARSQVTMLGDAAHLMLSLAAVAANLARVDVFELGVVLADTVHEGMRVEDPEREAAIAA